MMRRRVGRPGLLGTVARTAVIAGTATATAGAVSNHSQKKQAAAQQQQEQQAAAQQQATQQAAQQAAAQQAAAQPAAGGDDVVDQLTKLSAMKEQGLLSDSEFEAAKVKILGS